MREGLLTLVILLSSFLLAKAQSKEVRIGVTVGYNTYRFNELQVVQNYLLESIPEGEIAIPIQEFPSRMNFGFEISFPLEGNVVGLKYNFHSTGSRYHYSDYSGQVGLNSVIKGHFVGIIGMLNLYTSNNKRLKIFGGVVPSYIRGNYTSEQFLEIANEMDKTSFELNMQGMGAEVFFRAEKELSAILFFLKIGFDTTIYSEFVYEGNTVTKIGPVNEPSPNWEGLRTGLGFAVKL